MGSKGLGLVKGVLKDKRERVFCSSCLLSRELREKRMLIIILYIIVYRVMWILLRRIREKVYRKGRKIIRQY